MPVFRFKLDFLLSLRRKREEEAAHKLAKRLASIRELKTRIASMEDERERLRQELSKRAAKGAVNPGLIAMYGEYQTKLFTDLKKASELLTLSERERIKEQAALQKAAIDRQVMEKIKEKKAEAFKAETLHQEQIVLEEMAALVRAHKLKDS
jgi:flagellar FliJ protein